MTSLTTGFKQSGGYFIVLSATGFKVFDYTAGSGAGGSFLPGTMTANTAPTVAVGNILRDMGKTVLLGGVGGAVGATATGTTGVPTRVFRKVQLINTAGANTLPGNAPNGVSGNSTTYQTFYIELPTLGRSGSFVDNALGMQVVYVNSLPGLYV